MDRRKFFQAVAVGGGAGIVLPAFGQLEAASPAANAHLTYTVKGFSCFTCAVGLESVLQREKGVASVKAEYPSGKVTVGFDSRLIEASDIKRSIEAAGFHVAA